MLGIFLGDGDSRSRSASAVKLGTETVRVDFAVFG